MKFKYKKYEPNILRPVIPIEISHSGMTIPYEVLVDSGADICIFDGQIGKLLGIDVKSGKKMPVSGITGKAEFYYVHSVKLSVGGWSFEREVGFLPNIGSFGYGVVGQKGFFDTFIVKFDYKKAEIELKDIRN